MRNRNLIHRFYANTSAARVRIAKFITVGVNPTGEHKRPDQRPMQRDRESERSSFGIGPHEDVRRHCPLDSIGFVTMRAVICAPPSSASTCASRSHRVELSAATYTLF